MKDTLRYISILLMNIMETNEFPEPITCHSVIDKLTETKSKAVITAHCNLISDVVQVFVKASAAAALPDRPQIASLYSRALSLYWEAK